MIRAVILATALALSAALLYGVLHAALKLRAMAKGEGHAGKSRGLYGIIATASLVPCPGAAMMLLFALYAGMPWLGVVAVVAMSLGMGVVISAAGYLAYAGRTGLFRRLQDKENIIGAISDSLEVCSYLLVLGFSLCMAWPAVTGLLSRLGA